MPKAATIPGKSVSQGSYSAFVPAPLPPELDWTPRLIGALSDADRLVGRLAGEGGAPSQSAHLDPSICSA